MSPDLWTECCYGGKVQVGAILLISLADPGGNSRLYSFLLLGDIDLRLNLPGWGRTTTVGVRGRKGPYHNSTALHLGILGAQNKVHGHRVVLPLAS